MAGTVYAAGEMADKPGAAYAPDCEFTVRVNANPYVSRGGLKLAKALDVFGICLDGVVAADIGASTGGFTDCMLSKGAAEVYCVDVGYGQLAWKLRNDPRVVNMERTNARYLKRGDIDRLCSFAAIDVSFISLKKILPAVKELMNNEYWIIALIKPQFEAGREKVGKHGVVREKETHIDILINLMEFVNSIGMEVRGLTYSPVKGPEGNIEYLLLIGGPPDVNGSNPLSTGAEVAALAVKVAEEAHDEL